MKEFEFIAKHMKRLAEVDTIPVTFSLCVFPDSGKVAVNVYCSMSHEYVELKDEEDFVKHIDMLINKFTTQKNERILYLQKQISMLRGEV